MPKPSRPPLPPSNPCCRRWRRAITIGFPVAGDDGAARLGHQLAAVRCRGQSAPLDMRLLYARCVLGTFCRLIERLRSRAAAAPHRRRERGGPHPALRVSCDRYHALRGWALERRARLHPARAAGGDRLSQVLRGRAVRCRRIAPALGDGGTHRFREARPNAADAPTRYLKIGVYHFTSVDPHHEGCAAHGSDTARAATALLGRLGVQTGGGAHAWL